MFDENGLLNGDFITHLAVIKESYLDDREFTRESHVAQAGIRRDKPSQVQVEDVREGFKNATVEDLLQEEDDGFFSTPTRASSSSMAAASLPPGERSRSSKLGGSVAPGVTNKKPSKQKNLAAGC